MMFRKDEQILTQHLESISDQILDFNNEGNQMVRGYLPMVDLKTNTNIIDYWQTPYLRKMNKEMQTLIGEINQASKMHTMRKQLKMDEDPWDNYLIYDSKYIMPLICHSQELTIEEQILVTVFIKQSIREENISEYKPKGSALIKELVSFSQEFKDDDEDPSILERLKSCLQSNEVDQMEI